jgi:nicotinate-nucleotide pyrophosphorylase (carboxylating)
MTLKEFYKLHDKEITLAVKGALAEDKITADVTTGLVLPGYYGSKKLKAVLLCKQECILAGLDIFKKVFRQIDKNVKFKAYFKDADKLKKGMKVLEVTSSRQNLLRGERTALNFIQRMSGVASLTNEFVRKLKYKDAVILHTRKTTPGFRVFELAAVKTGGGNFHRSSLASSVMIKDNHIEAAGGIEEVFDKLLRKSISYNLKQNFEIEVRSMKDIQTVVKYGKGIIKVVMLDNFTPKMLPQAVKLLKTNGFKIELSGGINMRNFTKYQHKGVDFYSIGQLTHSYTSCDFSLEF